MERETNAGNPFGRQGLVCASPGATPLPLFRCPSDWFSNPTWKINDVSGAPLISLGTSNYVGSFGTKDLADCEKLKPGQICDGNGVFMHNQIVRIGDCTDGTSNILAVAERIGDNKTDHLSTWSGVVAKGSHPFSRILGSSNEPLESPDRHPSDYLSPHYKGNHFLMLDGQVRFVATKINLKVLQALTTRAGQEDINQLLAEGNPDLKENSGIPKRSSR
jgi:hypothetical protein